MATSVIRTKPNGKANSFDQHNFSIVKSVKSKSQSSSIISEDYITDLIETSNYFVTKVSNKNSVIVMPSEVLPFRVSFTTLGIESYGPNNPPPIGIAIIGNNNYIL
jgi:hypothetical protein